MNRNRTGFTLIELLIVVLIIGILAAIAIPKFSSVKQKAYRTQAISDLKSLQTAEESFFADSNRYAPLTELTTYSSSSGGAVSLIANSTSYWSATLTHPHLPGVSCGIAIGTANTIDAAAGEGEPVCR
jgi:type IV pilus assembly protein PilA